MTKQKIEEDEDKILKDGQVLRVPLTFMDSEQRRVAAQNSAALDPLQDHRPHFARLSNEDAKRREEMQAKADAALSARWRSPTQDAKAAAPPPAKASYASYDQRLSNRWRDAR